MNKIITPLCSKICSMLMFAALLCTLGFPAQDVAAQQVKQAVSSLQIKKGPLAAALKQLQVQTGIDIMYNAALLEKFQVQDASYSNQTVEAVLRDLLKRTGLEFTEKEGVIIIKAPEKQRVPVRGAVTDAGNGMALPGVSIQVKGTSYGATSDGEGAFTVNADPASDTLLLSYIGYRNMQVPLAGRRELSLSLKADASMLSSVVVVGYGETKKDYLTGAVSHVSEKDFNQGVFSSPEQLLQGKVAGLNITRSGDPNGTPAVMLRGPSTLRSGEAQEPFYVIDGVPGASIQLVSMNDIVSIDVLKDASSTAIYGARAANGVIMVTTRRAKEGQKWISYNGYGALEQVSNRIEMLSGDQLRQWLDENGKSLNPDHEDGANTDWQKEVTRNGISHNHNLSLGGGAGNTVYDASINYLQNEGIMKGSSLDRINIRANLEQRAFDDRLKINVALSNSVSTQHRIPQLVFQNMLLYMPTVNVKNADGTYKEDFSATRDYYNPVSLIENNEDRTKTKILLGNLRAELKLLPGLNYTVNLSMQDEQINRDVYYKQASALAQNIGGKAIRGAYSNTKKILETYFNYDKTFGRHGLKLLAGYSWQEDRRNDGFQSSNQGFVSDALSYNNLGVGNLPVGVLPDYGGTTIDVYRFISFYARANYVYADKYLLQVSARRDGSSVFGANNRWGIFPAVSAGWRLKQEPFLKEVNWLDDLKLRAGYGVTGNALGFGAFTAVLLYNSTGKFYYNGGLANSIGPTQNANPDLKWESTGMANIGLDFSFLNNRLGGSVDFYDKRTSDLIWEYSVPTTQYFLNKLIANAGKMSNKGVEIQLNAVPVRNNKFTWSTAVNLAHNRNNIESLSNDKFTLTSIPTAVLGGKGQSGNTSQMVVEGQPVGSFYIWKYMGKNDNGVSQFLKKDGTLTTSPTSDDFLYAGSAQPKLSYGWNNSFTYGNFDFNFFLRGVSGNKILNATLANLNSPSDAAIHNIPVYTLQESALDDKAFYLSDRYMESGSYLRMDNATLGYTVPLQSKYVRNLRFYVAANNLFVITDYSGIDPEINLGGLEPGIDNSNFYPKTRSFLLGVNMSF